MGPEVRGKAAWKVIGYYLKRAIPFFLLQRQIPMMLGLIVSDRCNLSCRHCRVANTGRPSMPYDLIARKLSEHYAHGFRELYISGGEPFLWREGDRRLEDVVKLAREIGYFHVHVYTNGLSPLESSADMLWVSLDGLKETYARIRGDHFDRVVRNIQNSTHKNIALIYVISAATRDGIKEFLEFTDSLNVMGVMFYFLTPYYGKDELFIPFEERKRIIDELMAFKKEKLPIFNSYAGLRLLQSGRWTRPNRTFAITDIEGDYVCCRYNRPEVCAECGYGTCTEVIALQKFRPSALTTLARFW
jgi:MoaA/NifB/PqqE/SkfB family radical SAM enzyme